MRNSIRRAGRDVARWKASRSASTRSLGERNDLAQHEPREIGRLAESGLRTTSRFVKPAKPRASLMPWPPALSTSRKTSVVGVSS